MNNPSTSLYLPKAGVVIVNYLNYYDTIKYINDYLLKQENIDLKIVVVDNSSPNESYPELIREFSGNEKVTIVANSSNSGYASGNNIGIKILEKTGCEYIIVSNNDIEIHNRKLIADLIKEHRRLGNVAFISPVMLVNGKPDREHSAWRLPDKWKEIFNSSYIFKFAGYWYLRRFYYETSNERSEALKVDCVAGSFFLGNIQTFRKIEYLDEGTFLYYEETILGKKVKTMGMQNYLIAFLSFIHRPSSAVDKVFSIKEKHRILLSSKTYFWKSYCNAGKPFLTLLKVLFAIYSLEHFILTPFRELKAKKMLTFRFDK